MLFDDHDVVALEHRVSYVYENLLHDSSLVGVDIVFHLHGLEDADGVAGIHGVANLDVEAEDGARERGFYSRCASCGGGGVAITFSPVLVRGAGAAFLGAAITGVLGF